MPTCTYKKRRHRKVAIGDLDTRIQILSREMGSTNFKPSEDFTCHAEPWALWETLKPEKIFDETNTSDEPTDIAIIRYDPEVTKEFFVEMDDQYYRILETEDLDRRQEWLMLIMTHRGAPTKVTNHA